MMVWEMSEDSLRTISDVGVKAAKLARTWTFPAKDLTSQRRHLAATQWLHGVSATIAIKMCFRHHFIAGLLTNLPTYVYTL